ncbi:MAG: hypothetical protein JRN68_03835 [Nitrososphaerota archaeon]|nr:hypothetical protein [Nitrososphaerota archaeon]
MSEYARVVLLDTCNLCERKKEKDSDYCIYHSEAFKIINEKFPLWKDAFGELSWKEYLENLIKNSATGQWIKEVAEGLLKKA